jgi:hypothetical protein
MYIVMFTCCDYALVMRRSFKMLHGEHVVVTLECSALELSKHT